MFGALLDFRKILLTLSGFFIQSSFNITLPFLCGASESMPIISALRGRGSKLLTWRPVWPRMELLKNQNKSPVQWSVTVSPELGKLLLGRDVFEISPGYIVRLLHVETSVLLCPGCMLGVLTCFCFRLVYSLNGVLVWEAVSCVT